MLKCHIAAIDKKVKSLSVSVSIGEDIRLPFQCGLCDMDYVGYTNRHFINALPNKVD